MKKIKKILIIRLGAIGDVIHTTAIASAVKAKHPETEVHYLTSALLYPLIENHPFVDKTFLFEENNKKSLKYVLDIAFQLRKEKYDVVFNLTNALRNFILSYIICPKVINKRSRRNTHAAEDYFLCAKKVFRDLELPQKLTLVIKDKIKESVRQMVKNEGRKIVVINPGGMNDYTRQGRIWNLQKWLELAKILTEKYGVFVAVAGAAGELEYHKPFFEIPNTQVLTGQLKLVQSAALYDIADLMISGDTGPLHVASALNTKLIALYGSTNPSKYAPFGKTESVITAGDNICKFCYKKRCKMLAPGEKYTPCMENISVQNIIDKIESEKLL